MRNAEQITRLTFEVEPAAHKQKLAEFLFEKLSSLSKMYIRELIRDGLCEVNGVHENSGYRLTPNDFVEIEADLARGTAMQPQQIDLDIVHEDNDLIVVNKPAGMLVHPSHREKTGTLLNALTYWLNAECGTENAESPTKNFALRIPHSALIRPGLVHRLDKNTSGLIVVAKNPTAHRHLSRSFMRKQVEKRYIALVQGIITDDHGTIDAPIGRHADLKHWSVHHEGKHSISNYRVVERRTDTTLIELEPVTGRTNQLRIHCELIGHPIVGDTRRGGRPFARLCLHAQTLAFPHPATNNIIRLETPMPPEFTTI